MAQRINYAEQSPELLSKFPEFLSAARESMIEEPIRNLGVVPTAQPNGCTFCLDIHAMLAKFGLDRSALSQRR